jgi:GxxExxY protein
MLLDDAALNRITGLILAAAIEVHRVLGPGLLESIYVECLVQELRARGLEFVQQVTVPITYKRHSPAIVLSSGSHRRE